MQPEGGAASDDLLASGEGRRQPGGRLRARLATSANIEDLRRRVYAPSDLSGYSARDRLMIYAADIFLYLLIRLVSMTVRWDARGVEHLEAIYASGHRAIFTSWHVCIIGATYFFRKRGIVVMSSYSRDAEYTGRVIKRFGYGTARGSSTRRGTRAMAEMAECLLNGIDVGFTIDGPRGPAYLAKPGAVTLARHTGQAIFPFHVAPRRYLELPSWDRLQIPLPFTRAIVRCGKPIYVSRDASAEEVEAKRAELQAALDRLRQESS
jgi:lysophospholipid acyltransferase (LPLAT)-like uncharacterized protein